MSTSNTTSLTQGNHSENNKILVLITSVSLLQEIVFKLLGGGSSPCPVLSEWVSHMGGGWQEMNKKYKTSPRIPLAQTHLISPLTLALWSLAKVTPYDLTVRGVNSQMIQLWNEPSSYLLQMQCVLKWNSGSIQLSESLSVMHIFINK